MHNQAVAKTIEWASRHDPRPAGKPLDERARWQPSVETASRALQNRSIDIETSAGVELQ